MQTFPFTFLFSVPGMANPFAPAPAVLRHEHRPQAHDAIQPDTKLVRNVDCTPRLPAPAYRRRPPLPGPPSAPLTGKRRWQASEDEPAPATVIVPRATGAFGTTLKYRDMSDARDEALDANGGDVVLGACIPPTFFSLRLFLLSARSIIVPYWY